MDGDEAQSLQLIHTLVAFPSRVMVSTMPDSNTQSAWLSFQPMQQEDFLETAPPVPLYEDDDDDDSQHLIPPESSPRSAENRKKASPILSRLKKTGSLRRNSSSSSKRRQPGSPSKNNKVQPVDGKNNRYCRGSCDSGESGGGGGGEMPPPAGIQRRSVGRFGGLRRLRGGGGSAAAGRKTSAASPSSTSDEQQPESGNSSFCVADEEDPVMALFRSRTTQRVRFALEDEPRERGSAAVIPSSYSSSSSPVNRQADESDEHSPSKSNRQDGFNIKKFMTGTLFGRSRTGSSLPNSDDEFDLEVEAAKKQVESDSEMVWASPTSAGEDEVAGAAEVVQTASGRSAVPSPSAEDQLLTISFAEDRETRASVIKLLNKARRAQVVHYRYGYAVKCYVKALDLLTAAKYPNDHPLVVKALESLNNAHFANGSYKNSANIVRLGIKYEDQGELVRALKMYTIAYRIRRDNLSSSHPSLVVLLNMLGSIQIKRGELEEAMAIYELALKDNTNTLDSSGNTDGSVQAEGGSDDSGNRQEAAPPAQGNFLTRSVTYREMGTIYEQWGDMEEALRMYHKSLDCMAEYKGLAGQYRCFQELLEPQDTRDADKSDWWNDGKDQSFSSVPSSPAGLQATPKESPGTSRLSCYSPCVTPDTQPLTPSDQRSPGFNDSADGMNGSGDGMELTFGKGRRHKEPFSGSASTEATPCRYDVFFPVSMEEKKKKKKRGAGKGNEKRGDFSDVDVALTIHRIAQLHRSQQQYNLALPAFYVSLRGMKYALGKSHPNVAAILGNIGNLKKEMGDMDGAYTTYQQVLAIESHRLGLSHPDVVVTLHNIATIDAARGNQDHALQLYSQVVNLQRKLFGEDHESVAVTSACMGDVYERTGDYKRATDCYEDALRIKIAALGRHSLEVARLLHKLGKLAIITEEFHLAHSYISKAALVYRLNKLREDDEWVVDVHRDAADVDAAIAMGRAGENLCEC